MKDLQTKTIEKLTEALDLLLHNIPPETVSTRAASSNHNVVAYIDTLTRLLHEVFYMQLDDVDDVEDTEDGNK